MMFRQAVAALAVPAATLTSTVLLAAPASADAGVSVTNDAGTAAIDSTYSTKLTVSGSGFQSVKNGHGGLYVFFGTVDGNWRPSQGGVSGSDYVYIPDSEAKNNQGFQRYVAFPGSDTASSANGGTMSESGDWSTAITVPGPKFQAVGRNNQTRTIDCRKQTCGIITVGAHGVSSAANETFTPVSVEDIFAEDPGATDDPGDQTTTDPTQTTAAPQETAPEKKRAVRPKLDVDRSSAVSGRVLSFTVSGLASGQQFSVIFDDGVAAAGPFQAGSEGQTTGVITLPTEVAAGTHELRVYGIANPPSMKFAVRTDSAEPASEPTEETTPAGWSNDRWGFAAAGLAGVLLVLALVRVVLLTRGRRRRAV